MATPEVRSAYRRLYRHALHAIRHAKPGRYVVREILRKAFREEDAKLDPRTLGRTIRFLDAAGRERGLEHSVLKNILYVNFLRHFHRTPTYRKHLNNALAKDRNMDTSTMIRSTAFVHYEKTLAMLNSTMGLCLR